MLGVKHVIRGVRLGRLVPQLSLTLLQRFILIGAVATVLLASGTAFWTSRYLVQRELQETSQDIADIVTHLVTPQVSEIYFSQPSQAKTEQWDAWLKQVTDVTHIDKVKIWGLDGTVIYSLDQSLIGQAFDSEFVQRAAGGEVVGVLELAPTSHTGPTGGFYEVYVPVIPKGAAGPIGIYEVYEPIAPLAASLRRIRGLVWTLSFVIFGLLFVALVAILVASRGQHLAFRDPLTGLANRYLFNERASTVLAASKRRRDTAALLSVDLARFKAVNDSLGHKAGDDLLVQVATRLSRSVRAADTVSRVGGDEFALLLTDTGSSEHATLFAERLQLMFKEPFIVREQKVHLGVNVGIALKTEDAAPSSVDAWLTQADTARLRSKAAGSDYKLYSATMHSDALERLQLEDDLRSALTRDELTLHFQPIFDAESRVSGAEVLVRWQRPGHGPVSPGEFIPLAEETGLIRDLDRWVTRAALKQSAVWKRGGTPLKLSVNYSPQTFQDPQFATFLEAALEETTVCPKGLTVEITEYVLAHPETSRRSLEALKTLGVNVALDDFGKGYSSLAYLESLPIDRIKIDRHFISGIGERPTSEAIIKTIIALTDNLHIESLAEGIEAAAQLSWLMGQGCNLFQGFFQGRPVPADVFTEQFLTHRKKIAAQEREVVPF